jgi:ectoine hydroxylase-related dioxygenase (phytanoyl-CoA dioxygenase family)
MAVNLMDVTRKYRREGFYSPLPILSITETTYHLAEVRRAEERLGNLHYRPKIHTVFRSPLELATASSVLDVVEALIGPNILLYNATYIIKEPESNSFVSLHQDLTYWGFSSDLLTSMWLALTPATETSGCMRMVPGSHLNGGREHQSIPGDENILYQNQTVDRSVIDQIQVAPLAPGQASFHHGWTLHESRPNGSDERRIGLNVNYISPAMSKHKGYRGTALLVRGTDSFGNFDSERLSKCDFDPDAIANLKRLERLHVDTAARPNTASH